MERSVTMRSEEEMYRLFLDIAREDPRVLALYMNGSRVNPNAERDIFQDYDIVYVVKETESFRCDGDWLPRFGKVLYMQYPDESPDHPSDKENFYGWLMQLADGNRVDLHVETLGHARRHIGDDTLCTILLDEQNLLPPIPPATDSGYWVKTPTEAQYHACCNEFWWCGNNLAKGLWRGEMPYVQDMANFVVRKQLEKMLSWKVGVQTAFGVSVGKSAKYMGRWLTAGEYQAYLATYFGGDVHDAWEAVLTMCGLFEQTARAVGQSLGYGYNEEEARAAYGFLQHVRGLPVDAAAVL